MVHVAGTGYHIAAAEMKDPAVIIHWAKSVYAIGVLYATAVTTPKISILALYLRVFTKQGVRLTCYVLIGIIVVNCFAFSFVAIFQCSPIAFVWNKSIPGGKCFNIQALYQASSAPNIATDLVIMVLPIPAIWQLQAPKIRKIGLVLIFLTGSM